MAFHYSNSRAPGGSCATYDIAPQTNLDSLPKSKPALELHSRAVSSVGIKSPFQRSQHRKQFQREADKKIYMEYEKCSEFFEFLLRFKVQNKTSLVPFQKYIQIVKIQKQNLKGTIKAEKFELQKYA